MSLGPRRRAGPSYVYGTPLTDETTCHPLRQHGIGASGPLILSRHAGIR